MIEAEGRIVAVTGDHAEVEYLGGAGCGSCSTEGGCGGGSGGGILGIGSRPQARIQVPTMDMAVVPGDKVVIGLPESGYLQASLAVYLLPLAGLFAGATLVAAIGGTDGAMALGGVAGLGAALFVLRRFAYRVIGRDRFRARIVRLVPDEEPTPVKG